MMMKIARFFRFFCRCSYLHKPPAQKKEPVRHYEASELVGMVKELEKVLEKKRRPF